MFAHIQIDMLYNKGMIFFYFNHFSLIIFHHSVWLGFELFGLRVQVHSIGYSLRSRTKDTTITIVIINPRQEMGLECGWHHAQKRWAENLRILKIMSVEDLRLDHAGNWATVIEAENGVLCHRVEFSTVATAVKFCKSWPAKMNWDLKHHEMCRTLGVLLA